MHARRQHTYGTSEPHTQYEMTSNDQQIGTDRKSVGFSSKYKATGRQVLGKTEELGDLVYKIGHTDQADLFIRTTEAIADYVSVVYGWDMRILVKQRKEAEYTKPKHPSTTTTVTTRGRGATETVTEPVAIDSAQLTDYKVELDNYHRDLRKYKDDKAKVFVVILGQCTVGVISWLENGNGLNELEANRDVVGLLKKLEAMAYSTGGEQDPFLTLTLSLRRLVGIQQGSMEQVAKYYKRFKISADVLTGHWGDFHPPNLVKDGRTKAETQDRFLARILLMGADKGRFGSMIEDLGNKYVAGTDNYPKTIEATLSLLSNYQNKTKHSGKSSDGSSNRMGASFAQQDNKKSSKKKKATNRGRSSASTTDGNDNEEEVDNNGGTNRRSRSPSRSRAEGWSS